MPVNYWCMEKTVQAVYEGRVLRPLEPVPLQERQEVTVTFRRGEYPSRPSATGVIRQMGQRGRHDISLDEVRLALSTIRGSLSETIIDERRDR